MNSPLGQPVVSDLAKQFIEALRFQQRVEQYSAMLSTAMVDQYARKQSQSPELFDDAGQARWVTIGSEQGTDGHRHGGHPVKIDSHGKMLTGAFAGQTMGEAFGGKKSEVASIPKKVFDWRKALSDYKASGFNGQHPTPAAIGHFRRQLTKGEPLTHPDGDITPEEFKEFDRAFVDQNKQFAKLNAGKSPEKPDSSKQHDSVFFEKGMRAAKAGVHVSHVPPNLTPGTLPHKSWIAGHAAGNPSSQLKDFPVASSDKDQLISDLENAENMGGWTKAKQIRAELDAKHPGWDDENMGHVSAPAKPGITLDTRANEAAKTGDQMGLFGDVNNVAKGKAKLDQVGTTKGHQMAMFDTKGDPDQMMMFDDGVTPEDRLMPEAKAGPKPFEPVLLGSDSPKKSDEANPTETGPIPLRERKEFAAKLANEGKLHSEIVDAMTARGVAASDARRLAANALGDKAQSQPLEPAVKPPEIEAKPPEIEAKQPEIEAKQPEPEAKPVEPPNKPEPIDEPLTPSEKATDLFSSDIAEGETPRAAAAAAQKKLDEDYEFARASDVRNAGEDLKGSARHKVNRWKNLEDAEKNGTAAELVTRDQLLKNEPHNLFVHADKNPLTALAMHYTLKAFPAKPGTGKRGDHEKDRKQYLEAYQSVKEKAEELAKTRDSADVVKAIGEMQNHVLGLIKQYRGQKPDDSIGRATATDMYNQTANDLVSLHKALATNWRANKTGVAGRTNEFGQAAKERYGDLSVDNIAEHAKDVMEGKSLNVTFGRDKKQSNRFDPSEMYVKIATRKGGRDLSGVTGDANKATKHMVESMGLRGIQWGNSVTDDERKHHAGKAVEALTDLADTLGLHPKDIALDGKLGLAIGARGRGGAVAHYEPDSQVINLTRTSGVGSLAHEWAHGFDHALNDYNVSRFMSDDTDTHTIRDKSGRLTYESTTSKPEHMQKMGYVVTERSKTGIRKAMADLADAQKDYRNRLHKFVNDNVLGSKQQSYWKSEKEIFARTFERYVQHKLESSDKKNTYLAGIETKGHKFDGFWPTDDEVKAMAPAFDKLFEEYRKHRHGSSDPVKYSRTEAVSAFTPLLIDRYITKNKSAVDRYSNPHWSEQVRDNLGQWSTSSMPEVDESLLDNHKQSGPKLRHWLRDWSMQHLRDKRFTNQENGWSVLVNKDCIKKLSNQSTNSAVCLLVLDQLLEKAKLLESKPSSDNHPNELAWHYLVHPVKINGSLYAAKIDVVESGTHGHKAYSLHAIEIEKGPPQIPARAKHTTPALGDPLKISIDEIYKKINEEGGRYSANQENLWLAVTIEESTIDRYEWVESQHPRNPAGISSGGQFRSTKLRELPDTDTVRGVDKSHDFHHSKLPPDLQKQALNWSAELHRLVGQPMNTNYDEQLAKDAGKPMTPEQVQQLKEQRWKSVDKNEVRKLLDQMNQMDKQAKLHGIDLASHVNASRLIPPELAMRLNGGRRFFDPSRVKAKAAPSQSSQQQTQQQPESKRWQDDPAKMAEYERRKGLTPSQPKSVDPNRVVPGTVVQNKNRPNHIINENLASHINGEKKAIAATPEPEQSSFSPAHGLSSQAAGKVDRAAADTVGDGDQSKVDHFKGLIMDAWKIARDQAQEHNAALNTLQNLAGGSTFAARLSQHLARGGDVASVEGFDTVVDHARRHFPHLVGGADDAESGVVDMFRSGMKPVPQPWHDEVIDQAVQMAPQGFFDEYVPSAANASHDEPVPFSVVADCRHFVQCYWLRSFKDYYAGKSQMSFNWDETAHPRETAKHDGKQPGQFAPKSAGKLPDGFVAQPRAKAGGETSEVDGKFYKGGALMPVHGLFSGQEKPAQKKPKHEGTSPIVNANEDGKGVKAVRERSKEQIEADRERMEHQRKWDELKSGPIAELFGWIGDRPNSKDFRQSPGHKFWAPMAEKLGTSGVDELTKFMREKAIEREKNGLTEPMYSNVKEKMIGPDEQLANYIENIEWGIENYQHFHTKKHLKAVPNSRAGEVWLGEFIKDSSMDDKLALNNKLKELLTPKPTASATAKSVSDATKQGASRKRSNIGVFVKPIVGPSGSSLVAYDWKWTWEPSEDGEDERKVSDWSMSEKNERTGRDIVHHFQVRTPDGLKVMSVESAIKELGLVGEAVSKVRNLASAHIKLAQAKQKLQQLKESKASDYSIGWAQGDVDRLEKHAKILESEAAKRASGKNPVDEYRDLLRNTHEAAAKLNGKKNDSWGIVGETVKQLRKQGQYSDSQIESIRRDGLRIISALNKAGGLTMFGEKQSSGPHADEWTFRNWAKAKDETVKASSDIQMRNWFAKHGEKAKQAVEDAEAWLEKYGSTKDKYSTAFNPTLHPRDNGGRFSAVGDSFKTAAYGLKDPMHVKIDGIDNNLAKVSNGFMSASVPVDSLEQLKSDTTGDYSYLKVFGESKSPEVNKVINGQAKFIGKGADGVVHDVGDSVVKSSTTVPYHTVGGGTHLTPEEAVESFGRKINIERAMHAAGIPGVMKTRSGMHGNKIFSVRPKLNIGKKLTDSQLRQVEESIKAMHAAGYSINDEIQVGTDESGNVFHYDLGQASSGATDASKKDDWGHYRRFVEANNKMTDGYSITMPRYHQRMKFTSSLLEADLADRYALRHHPMHAAAPTEAQKEAGNYRMSHIKFQGLDITIETPKGRSRRPEWPTMKAHYGYFKRTTGADDENIDCFVGPDKNADTVYIIDQVNPNGQFDEVKCLIGFPTREAAIAAYRGSYSIGWRVGKVTVMTMDGFKKWLKSEESCKPAAAC